MSPDATASEPGQDSTASTRSELAFRVAARLHAGQTRRGTSIPYISHLLHVAGLVLEYGGDDDLVAAAFLHDTIEDCGADPAMLRREFGDRVAGVVVDLTDSLAGDPVRDATTWEARKLRSVHHLRVAGADTALVAACDKGHNLTCLVADLHADGPATLARFHAGADRLVWYHRAVLDAVADRIPPRLAAELGRLVAELDRLTADA